MLKVLVFVALVLAVLYFFTWANRRPPGDWRRDGEDDGPLTPTGRIGLDDDTRPPSAPAPEDELEDAGTGNRRRDN
jgi:hypothetical protein